MSAEDPKQDDEGRLIGIAVRPERRAAMVTVDRAAINAETGLEGDHAGKHPKRIVTVMTLADWEASLDRLDPRPDLAWTTRRANLLVDGVSLPRAAGGVIAVGPVVLEVTGETVPCSRMDEAHPGLRKALSPDWCGGVLCQVRQEGAVALGDPVAILFAPEPRTRHLP